MLPKLPARLAALLVLMLSATVMSASAADASLINTRWTLVSVRGIPAVSGRGDPHLILGPDGGLEGGTGCNQMGGAFTVEGGAISFGPIRTTRMYCADAYRTEQEFLKALPMVGRWSVNGNQLELMSPDGVSLAIFTAA